jgi:HD superfamily phosphodiesterase
MKKENLIKKFYRINRELYEKAKNPLPSHGPEHHCRVLANALEIAKEFKGVDPEVLIPACLLHDLGAYYPARAGAKYHEEDLIRTKKVLVKINLSEWKKTKIIESIANHGSDPKYKNKKESIETTILRDADKLEAFGPMGVARIIMARSLQGDPLTEIAKKYSAGGYLEKKWKSMTIQKAKLMAKENYKYSLNFFSKLAKELRINPECRN